MNCTDAALKSSLHVAHRSKADGSLMFYDQTNNVFKLQYGRGGDLKSCCCSVADIDDWLPLYNDPPNHPMTVWRDKRGPIADPLWKVACNNSPVGKATRLNKHDFLMVRGADGSTWLQNPAYNVLNRVEVNNSFHYMGWQPMTESNPLAQADYSQELIPFWDTRWPPNLIKGDHTQIQEWVLTGSCPALRERQAMTKAEVAAHNEAIDKRRNVKCTKCLDTKRVSVPGGHGDTDSVPCPECDPHDCRGFPVCPKCKGLGYVDYTGERKPCSKCQPAPIAREIAPESNDRVLALAATIQVMADIGEKKMALKLAKQLSHIIGV